MFFWIVHTPKACTFDHGVQVTVQQQLSYSLKLLVFQLDTCLVLLSGSWIHSRHRLTWLIVHGLQCMAYSAWPIVHGLQSLAYSAWLMVHGI